MKKVIYLVTAIIAIGVYSCQKDNSVQKKSFNATLSKAAPRDTTPPDFRIMRDTTPPDRVKK